MAARKKVPVVLNGGSTRIFHGAPLSCPSSRKILAMPPHSFGTYIPRGRGSLQVLCVPSKYCHCDVIICAYRGRGAKFKILCTRALVQQIEINYMCIISMMYACSINETTCTSMPIKYRTWCIYDYKRFLGIWCKLVTSKRCASFRVFL